MKSLAMTFMRIDQWLFDRLTEFKETPPYQKFQEFLGGLDEEVRAKVAPALLILILISPLPLLGIFWKLNTQFKNQLQMKSEILEKASMLLAQKTEVENASRNLNNQGPFTQSSFITRLKSQITAQQVSMDKIIVQNIVVNPTSPHVAEVTGQVAFRQLAHKQMSLLLEILTVREGLSITDLEINALPQEKLLTGTLQFKKLTQNTESTGGEQ